MKRRIYTAGKSILRILETYNDEIGNAKTREISEDSVAELQDIIASADTRIDLFRLLSDFMNECPDSVTASDAYRDVTATTPETSPWNPNASTTAVPNDFVIRMDSV